MCELADARLETEQDLRSNNNKLRQTTGAYPFAIKEQPVLSRHNLAKTRKKQCYNAVITQKEDNALKKDQFK